MLHVWFCLPFGDVYGFILLGILADALNEEVDVLGDKRFLLLQTFFRERIIEQSAEASMFVGAGIHYALGAIFALWDPGRVPRPLLIATVVGEDVVPRLRVGIAEFIWSQADHVAVLAVNPGGVLLQESEQLPVVLPTPTGQKVTGVLVGNSRLIPMATC